MIPKGKCVIRTSITIFWILNAFYAIITTCGSWKSNRQIFTCWTSIPRAHTSVVIRTLDWPDRNSFIIASLSFCGISPCIELTVKLASRIFSVSQSTYNNKIQHKKLKRGFEGFISSLIFFIKAIYGKPTLRLVLQKMTAWVIVKVSYKSHKVSNFHSSLSTATKNCLIPRIRCA